MKLFISLISAILLLTACKHETTYVEQESDELRKLMNEHSPTGQWDYYKMPESSDLTSIPNQDPKNPITQAKVDLGRMLFFETAIGTKGKEVDLKGTYSCSSCHVPEKSFTPGRFQGIADGGVGFGELGSGRTISPKYQGHEVDAQGARPLPTINLAYVKNALWNGAFGSTGLNVGTNKIWGVADTMTSINHKIFEGLEANNTRALIVHRQQIDEDFVKKIGYKEMFDNAFPNIEEKDRYSLQTASNAIASYFRTIYTNKAPFQNWLKGDEYALTVNQKDGAKLFFGKAGCINCHNSPSFNGQLFAAIGVKDLDQSGYLVYKTNDGRNKGRGGFTLQDEDLYKFKVPQLYNLKDIGFYFHGASHTNLKDVVRYFNNAVPENNRVDAKRIDSRFVPLKLTETEIKDITEFIEYGLYDPSLVRYKPQSTISKNCFPNNDTQSRIDMGCK
jgi:cytochrome c peroxidase